MITETDMEKLNGTSYPGGKRGAGVYQAIINMMPPHRTYVEAFLGGGSILRMKKPAAWSIGIEANPLISHAWDPNTIAGLNVITADAISWMQTRKHASNVLTLPDTLLYLDPPYLLEVRKSKNRLYGDYDFRTALEHEELLRTIADLKCMVMISGYDHPLYDQKLKGWRKEQFAGCSRQGPTTETVWLNFAAPSQLHDYRYLGENFRKRQDLNRKRERWLRRLRAMNPTERNMISAAIAEIAAELQSCPDDRQPAEMGT